MSYGLLRFATAQAHGPRVATVCTVAQRCDRQQSQRAMHTNHRAMGAAMPMLPQYCE